MLRHMPRRMGALHLLSACDRDSCDVGDVLRLIEASALDEVVVTNSIAHEWDAAITKKVKQLSIGKMLADVIATVHSQASVLGLLETCKWTHGA